MNRIHYGILLTVCLVMFGTHTLALASNSAGKGDYEPYNAKKLTQTAEKKSMAKFFGGGSNRAPAHDTPASACKCSKYSPRHAYIICVFV